jgi:ATP-dependent helicase/nuclease subunit A
MSRGPEQSVRPGAHTPRRGDHQVVWWDPSALALDRQDEVGLRQQRILSADTDATTGRDREGERVHAEWVARRDAARAQGGTRTLDVVTMSDARRAGDARAAVAYEATAAAKGARPHGKRFGILVHASLAVIPLDADEATVKRNARAHGVLVGATPPEIDAAAVAVTEALAHPLLARARKAGASCRRECHVLVKLDDGAIAEGILDLAFREKGAWTVVDFKTDAELGVRRDAYEAQVALYARAVAAATGDPASAVLFSV